MPAVNLSAIFNDAQLDSNGNPYTGAKLFTCAAGSSTKQVYGLGQVEEALDFRTAAALSYSRTRRTL